jgi:single-stranded-DNA-specific exonuclease RecJ
MAMLPQQKDFNMAVWEKKDIDKNMVRDIAENYSCDLLTAFILVNRGITTDEEIPYFLGDAPHLLKDPFLLPGISEAVNRLLQARTKHEKILVFGDRDVDGITGTVLLTDYLQRLGMDICWRIPVGDEPYGLSAKAVKEFASTGGTLIITVDCGISSIAEVKLAQELGLSVIVTDHHKPKETLPAALAIVNPKLPYSSYPFRDLSGCVVAYKLVSALQVTLKAQGIPNFPQKDSEYLQLAALGTVADMMPLRNENRIVVRKGLAALMEKPRMGLSELLIMLGLSGKPISTEELSWILCPTINAAGRMGSPDKAVALLLETDPIKRIELAGEIKTMNEKRKRLGTKTWPLVEQMASESITRFEGKLVIAAGENIYRGITGIMANRLVNRFQLPAMVVCLGEELAIGSIRSPGNYDLRLLLEPLSDIINNYGGHECAVGFNLQRSLWDQFLNRLEIEVSTIQYTEVADTESITVDAELPHNYITPEIFTVIDRFEPYGTGNEPLVFASQELKIIDMVLMGKRAPKHVKFTLDTGKYKWSAIFWKAANTIDKEFDIGDKINLMYTINRNWYKGIEKPQIIIRDIVKSAIF